MGRVLAGLAMGVSLAACCPGTADEGGGDTATPAATAYRFAEAVPTGGEAKATTLVVRNTTKQDVTLDLSWGEGSPFGMVSLDRPLGQLGLYADFYCNSECGGPDMCIECEEPRDRLEVIPPGGSWAWRWDGRLIRHRQDRTVGCDCFDAFAPEPGRYLLTVCGQGGACASREVAFPAPETLEIDLGADAVGQASCDDAALAPRAASLALARMELFGVAPERIPACEGVQVSCLPVGTEAKTTAAAGQCQLFATMDGDALDLLVYVPREGDTPEASRYTTRFGMPGTRIIRVAYGR
jgi:hypothetical protein